MLCLIGWGPAPLPAQEIVEKFSQEDKFRQLEEILPTPNDYRTASGAPGPAYWQQRVDYIIDVEIDDENQQLIGSERITYHNRSPDPLRYVWLQLDANIRRPHSDANLTRTQDDLDRMSFGGLQRMLDSQSFDGGIKIAKVADTHTGDDLEFTIVKTMMRIDLPQPLPSGESYSFDVDWSYAINDSSRVRGRTGFEFFEADGNYLYEMAQWYPRAVAYTDATGWQHKQFLGRGEFTLDFGKFLVRITVPDNHVVASTGELQNPTEVLTSAQIERLTEARSSDKPLFVITPEEARANEESTAQGKKTWVFSAEKVRDFAFATSKKFIWDAMGFDTREGNNVLCMSFYPNEGEPLWSRYSTHAVAHTLDVYGRFAFPYPYPVAISVNGPVGGMEYPMICFNGPRPEEDGTYSQRSKYGLISVVIHEVGHNWFPMIVNSDERQWTWMDEGLNTFLQSLAETEWEDDYPSRRGQPRTITDFMKSPNQVPIMTNSDSLLQFGNNAYAKPAAALAVLRDTVMGRELFDFAFRQYAERWKFKRPMPADFFRSMEDASAIDLDWFWRGWFYTTDHVDLALADVQRIELIADNEYDRKTDQQTQQAAEPAAVHADLDKQLPKRVEAFPELEDFYNQYDPLEITDDDRQGLQEFLDGLTDEQAELLEQKPYLYRVEIVNQGGVVSPLILELEFTDGKTEILRIPAEIWRRNNERVTKLLLLERPVKQITLDPFWETADVDVANNVYPPRIQDDSIPLNRSRFGRGNRGRNPMQRARDAASDNTDEKASDDAEEHTADESEDHDAEDHDAEPTGSEAAESEGGQSEEGGGRS